MVELERKDAHSVGNAHIKEEKADSTDNETNLKENRC